MQLNDFKYHPNLFKIGSIEQLDSKSNCCGTVTEYFYTGSVFDEEELDDYSCLWFKNQGISIHLPGTSRYQGDFI